MLKSESVLIFFSSRRSILLGSISHLAVSDRKMDRQDFVAAKQEAKEEQVLLIFWLLLQFNFWVSSFKGYVIP